MNQTDYNNLDPSPNFVTFHGFLLDSGNIESLKSLPTRRIEFIGDSITAGFCNLCPVDNNPTYEVESFALSWPSLVSQRLNATYHTSAWSGFGMVRNCCGGSTYMPEIFTRILGSVVGVGNDWNFSDWIPDVVVINLGTNDGLNEVIAGNPLIPAIIIL